MILLFPIICFAQFTDDFSDSDFTNNPTWVGNTSKFTIDASNLLQLNDVDAGTSYLATESQAIADASWEFLVKMNFNPSSSNYCDVYITSNTSDLNSVTSGYFVRIGNTTRNVCLYRKTPSSSVKIISGTDNRVNTSTVNVRVKVTRDIEGNWNLVSDTLGGTNYYSEGSVFDNTYENSAFFGVKCIYSKTRAQHFFFDDFIVTGESCVDNIIPEVLSISALSANEISVVFSELTDPSTSLNLNNYILDPEFGNPIYAITDPQNANAVIIQFSSSFRENINYTLTVKNIKDLCNNILITRTLNLSFFRIKAYNVIISEIMAKPDPVVLLPNVEYIELYNRSANDIDLSLWSINVGNTSRKLPYYKLSSGKYVILCNENSASLFGEITNVLGVSGFPTLANSGAILTLKDKDNNIIHTVNYSDTWYNDQYKKNGGYSLEIIDLHNPCGTKDNWTATNDRNGGTPGKINSVNSINTDNIPPYPYAAEVIAPDTIIVYFNEILQEEYANSINNFYIADIGHPVWIKAVEPDFSTIIMKFSTSFEVGKLYYLNIFESIRDCSGNQIESNSRIRFAIADSVVRNDIVINEILFNPYSGGKDFVEFYNRSEKILDLKYLWISNKASDGSLDNTVQLSTKSRLLLPEEYCAVTTDISDLMNNYIILHPENLYQVKSIPSMPDDIGSIVLTNRYLDIIDDVSYNKNQHYKLLSSQDGVSLERINYNQPSNDLSNWHSAAQDAGFATPGYKNSQFSLEINNNSVISVSPKSFSPDNDGHDDRLTISYKLDDLGYTATMSIYSSNGSFITYIANNEMLSVEGNLFWDGFDKDNMLCPMGIYILYVEMFNLNGNKIVEKHAIVLSNKK